MKAMQDVVPNVLGAVEDRDQHEDCRIQGAWRGVGGVVSYYSLFNRE